MWHSLPNWHCWASLRLRLRVTGATSHLIIWKKPQATFMSQAWAQRDLLKWQCHMCSTSYFTYSESHKVSVIVVAWGCLSHHVTGACLWGLGFLPLQCIPWKSGAFRLYGAWSSLRTTGGWTSSGRSMKTWKTTQMCGKTYSGWPKSTSRVRPRERSLKGSTEITGPELQPWWSEIDLHIGQVTFFRF